MGYLLKFGLEKQIIVSRIREIGGFDLKREETHKKILYVHDFDPAKEYLSGTEFVLNDDMSWILDDLKKEMEKEGENNDD